MRFDKRLFLTVVATLGMVFMVGSCTNSPPPATITSSGGVASTPDQTSLQPGQQPSQMEPGQQPLSQSDAQAPAQLQSPVSGQTAGNEQVIYDVEEAIETIQSEPQLTDFSTASNEQEAEQPEAETVQLTVPPEEVEDAAEDESELDATGIVATLTDTELLLQDGTVFLVNADTEFDGEVVAGTEVEVEYCCQSAKVGQIGTREDYCYEELRVSSLRVLL